MNNIIVINFKNIISELKNKKIKILFIKNNIFIEDIQKNLYQIETYRSHSYLDKLIEDGAIVTFNLVDNRISKNIGNWEKKVCEISEIETLIKRQKLFTD